MITLILVGGDSNRFNQAGYSGPKSLLPFWGGKCVLEVVISEMGLENVVLCGRERDRLAFSEIVGKMGLDSVWSESVHGPIYGVLDACNYLTRSDEQILVIYCDTIIRGGIQDLLAEWQRDRSDSGVVVFRSNDPRYGYWLDGRVSEKQVKSSLAVSGLFYFKSSMSALLLSKAASAPGVGVPSILNRDTHAIELPNSRVIDVGVPEDYLKHLGGINGQ